MSLATTVPRKQAQRLARPATRYWKGKAPKGVTDVASDSDDEEDDEGQLEGGDVSMAGEQDIVEEDKEEPAPILAKQPGKAMNVALRDVNISQEGKVIVAGREESGRTAVEAEEESEEESDEDEAPSTVPPDAAAGAEEESSEYETDSEEEEPPKPQFRPVFVPKRARVTVEERELIAQDTEEALKKKELEAEERRKQSHDLVAESIRRELAEKEKEEIVPDVDDTDGIDPEGEFEAWRLRELERIKRDKEEEVRREVEREEVERRRALPEEQRMKEDLERAQKLREEKPKGQQKFLQKYWHKGAFHQDEEILQRHDFTESTESTVDVSVLPKVMQVKNFGKRSRTKYTHLLDQDTTVSGGAPVKAGGPSAEGSGCFLCGGPHMKKDCPQNTGPPGPGGRLAGSGANSTAASGTRQWGAPPPNRDRDEAWKDRDINRAGRHENGDRKRQDEDRYRSYDRYHERREDPDHAYNGDRDQRQNGKSRDRNEGWSMDRRRYSRSRSRSPLRRGDHEEHDRSQRRRRSRSRTPEYSRDKRRRLD